VGEKQVGKSNNSNGGLILHEFTITPGDHTFFLVKNCFGNTSCVSNMFFLKKNENFLSMKNIIKMNHFIPIFLLWKMAYFTEKKICEK
jgi:hypothetical protein